MARVESVQLVDDLDGGVAEETVSFSLGGAHWEIDLTAAHAAELRAALAPFVDAARRASGGSRGGRNLPGRAPAAASGATRRQTAEIRRWALANGFELSERGRIPNSVVEAYDRRSDDRSAATPPGREEEPAPAAPPARPATGPVDVSGLFKEASTV